MMKWTFRALIALTIALVGGFFFFGRDLPSYVKSSVNSIKESVQSNVPVELEIQRARDLLDEIEPEIINNIREVAREEVEISVLESELRDKEASVASEQSKIRRLREKLDGEHVSYRIGRQKFTRTQLLEDLARRLENVQSAEALVAQKSKLLTTRQAALTAALRQLEEARQERAELSAQISTLESEYRLLAAETEGSKFEIDSSKLGQTKRLIDELRKRLEIQKKVLSSEAKFIEDIPIEALETETSVLERADAYLSGKEKDVASF